jgi:hypothetical protein
MAYLLFLLVDNALKLVDGGTGLCELLLANGYTSADGRDKPKGDGLGGAMDVVIIIVCDYAEEGFGHTG